MTHLQTILDRAPVELYIGEGKGAPMPAMTPSEFVRALYKIALGREADSDGLSHWIQAMESSGDPSIVLRGILDSQEFRLRCEGPEFQADLAKDDEMQYPERVAEVPNVSAEEVHRPLPAPPIGFARDSLFAGIQWHQGWDIFEGVRLPGRNSVEELCGRLRLPTDLTGKRILDVGAWHGAFSFECERRGASEVVAFSLEDPELTGFHRIKTLLNSKVEYVVGFSETKNVKADIRPNFFADGLQASMDLRTSEWCHSASGKIGVTHLLQFFRGNRH